MHVFTSSETPSPSDLIRSWKSISEKQLRLIRWMCKSNILHAVDINSVHKKFLKACEDYETTKDYGYFELAQTFKNQITDMEIHLAVISKKKKELSKLFLQ